MIKSIFCKHLILFINLNITSLSERYLDSSISIEEKSLITDGGKLLHANHPSDTKRGGVYIYTM